MSNNSKVGRTFLCCTSEFWYCTGGVMQAVKVLAQAGNWSKVQWPTRVTFGWWRPNPKLVSNNDLWEEVEEASL